MKTFLVLLFYLRNNRWKIISSGGWRKKKTFTIFSFWWANIFFRLFPFAIRTLGGSLKPPTIGARHSTFPGLSNLFYRIERTCLKRRVNFMYHRHNFPLMIRGNVAQHDSQFTISLSFQLPCQRWITRFTTEQNVIITLQICNICDRWYEMLQ